MRLGILVSGRGSNLEAVLDARLPGIEPVVVVSNRPGVRALDVAAARGVPTVLLQRRNFQTAAARDRAIGATLTEARAELALLAGYDQVLRPSFFEAFTGRAINIHPSLLPAHGGAGMVGLAVHRSVLAAHEPETGVTVHEVTPEVDAGPILLQARVPVLPDDDAETLAARVLEHEHRVLVATLSELSGG